MKRKTLVVGIILLFIGTSVIPSGTSMQTDGKKIITVDNEPGDADYISIKEAVHHLNPGDIIEVYSGTYYEHDITISVRGITLQGVAHELGGGNDTGKPVVNTTANLTIFYVQGDDVTITNFVIIDYSEHNIMTFPIHIWGNNCTFSYNNVSGGFITVWVGGDEYHPDHYPIKTRIIGNTIENTTSGVDFSNKYGNISNNRFRWCDHRAIRVFEGSSSDIISNNVISNCSTGIEYGNGSDSLICHNIISAGTGIDLGVYKAKNISIVNNEFQECGTGIRLVISWNLAQIKQNNFINNTRDILFVQLLPLKFNLVFHRIFNGNYYDTWKGFGPKLIWGATIIFVIPIWIPQIFFFLPIWVPWVYRDLNPAQEPYNIGG